MTTLFGIKNCDTVKKARRWLESQEINYHFHDLRADGIDAKQIKAWLQQVDLDSLINKRSTTWKGLSDSDKQKLNDNKAAIALILEHPTLIKRPVLDTQGKLQLGFKADNYRSVFQP